MINLKVTSKKVVTSGKRKTSVARAILVEGSGKININKKDYQTLQIFDKLKIEEPIRIAEKILGKINFDISISVKGGGEITQCQLLISYHSSQMTLSQAGNARLSGQ